MYNCILVGYDGSTSSRKALAKALELGRRLESRVVIATVIPRPVLLVGEYLSPDPGELERMRETVRKALEKLVGELKASGYSNSSYVVLEGDPAEELVNYARENQCNLIVVGRRGQGGLERLILGSISQKVVSMARGIDVLVVG